ncbi:hypothetical protein AWZ03_015442 [Drosophila navojoa]|uniref:Reverse transcriptase domain-containing protein n=1 Tax=Drosophila navojoa TaxID=7232 RepID=A0A484AMV6_DRONA|nr:hypothetical protein AWZ03_015442 [Drosophila navojoa]
MPLPPSNSDMLIATYADDTAILSRNKSPEAASSQMQVYLQDLNRWLTRWSIGINAQKSTHITFATRRGACPEVTLGAPIPRANKVKYLGVTLDKRLTYGPHITETAKKCKYKLKKT